MGDDEWRTANCTMEVVTKEVRCFVDGVAVGYAAEVDAEECEHVVPPGSADFWGFFLAALICICFAGAMSGLTVGLMSFDEKNLSVLIAQSKDRTERYHAQRVLSLIKHHHMLLVTLLFWNAAAFESLPIFLDRLVPSWAAILISVTLILIFGEIVPQAACTGPRKLVIGSNSYWPVWALMIVTWPVARVFATALDWAVGKDAHHGGSKFMYVPRSTLGLVESPNQMALVEVHGVEEDIAPDSPGLSPPGSPAFKTDTMPTEVLPPLVVKTRKSVSSPAAKDEANGEEISTKLVVADDGEVDDDSDGVANGDSPA